MNGKRPQCGVKERAWFELSPLLWSSSDPIMTANTVLSSDAPSKAQNGATHRNLNGESCWRVGDNWCIPIFMGKRGRAKLPGAVRPSRCCMRRPTKAYGWVPHMQF